MRKPVIVYSSVSTFKEWLINLWPEHNQKPTVILICGSKCMYIRMCIHT